MKKCAVLVLLLGATFCLFAQNAEDITIYVPQITGTGATPNDNADFTEIIKRELEARKVPVKDTREEAYYALIGTLTPSDGNAEGGVYVLSLMLQDKEDLIVYEQFFFYSTYEEANAYISTVLLNMLSSIFVMHVGVPAERVYVEKPAEPPEPSEPPVEEEDEDAWRNRLWYIGADFFWSPRIYYGTKTEFFPFSFGFGIHVELHLQKYMVENLEILYYLAVGTGLEFSTDWVVASPRINDEYRNTILQIPINIYWVYKPGAVSLLQPYLGILFNIPLLPETIPPVLSWQAGFQYGIEAFKGAAYAEIRFSMDFGKSGFSANHPGDPRQYDRYMLYLGVGYKYDLIKFVEPAVNYIKNKIQDIKDKTAKPVREQEEPEEAAVEEPADEAAVADETAEETADEAAVEEPADEATEEPADEPAVAEPADEASSADEAAETENTVTTTAE